MIFTYYFPQKDRETRTKQKPHRETPKRNNRIPKLVSETEYNSNNHPNVKKTSTDEKKKKRSAEMREKENIPRRRKKVQMKEKAELERE